MDDTGGAGPERERVVVALGAPDGSGLIRAAAGLASRSGAELIGVHVRVRDEVVDATAAAANARLLESHGGTYLELDADDAVDALRTFAVEVGAAQVVLGRTSRSRWRDLTSRSVLDHLARDAPFDVHVVNPARWQRVTTAASRRPPIAARRRVAAWALAAAGVPAITTALVPFRSEHGVSTALLLHTLLTVAVAATGGALPAAAVAVAAFFAVNWFLTPPYHGLHIEQPSNLLALVTFLVVGAVVSFLLGQVSRRASEATRAQREAEALERERRRLQVEAAEAEALAETDRLRTALLRAVSHDLRTPLASIKASVSSLLQDDVDWSPEATAEFLATIEEETDRLDRVVGNLLDMGRLQAGALQVSARPVALEEVVPAALTSLSTDTARVELDVDEHSPRVEADPALLERAVANVVSNALAWTSTDTCVRVAVDERAPDVELRIVDHGPGVPEEDRERLFEPFQRLGDRSNDSGAGLGLAVARGFVEAMGGRIRMEDTPGGGLTMVIVLRGVAA